MLFIVLILSLYVFWKTIGYAIYEYTDNGEKVTAIIVGVLGVIALVRFYCCYNNKIKYPLATPEDILSFS